MKKLIVSLVVLSGILFAGSACFGLTVIPGTNFKKSYSKWANPVAMYYGPGVDVLFGPDSSAWASTELSVSTDMDAYATCRIYGDNGVIKTAKNYEASNGFIKTDANEASNLGTKYAKQVRHGGRRDLNGYITSYDYSVE